MARYNIHHRRICSHFEVAESGCSAKQYCPGCPQSDFHLRRQELVTRIVTHRTIKRSLNSLAGPIDYPVARRLSQAQVARIGRWDPTRKNLKRSIPGSRWTWPGALFRDENIVPLDIVTGRRPD